MLIALALSQMLNDVAAFLVQLYSRQISALKRPHTRETTGFTYGFVSALYYRAEPSSDVQVF